MVGAWSGHVMRQQLVEWEGQHHETMLLKWLMAAVMVMWEDVRVMWEDVRVMWEDVMVMWEDVRVMREDVRVIVEKMWPIFCFSLQFSSWF